MINRTLIAITAVSAFSLAACGGAAAPFDRLEGSQVVVYRLQNYEPPAAATTTPQAGALPQLIPGLTIPPEIQTWVQQGAQGLGGLLPGLQIPGITTPAQTTTQPVQETPRFEGFRILGQSQVLDSKMRTQLIDIFGKESNFDEKAGACLYPELGVSYPQTPPMLPYDILISFSCNRIEPKNFQWPHPGRGMKKDTVQKFSSITQQLFGGG